jgi:hypothetical protein
MLIMQKNLFEMSGVTLGIASMLAFGASTQADHHESESSSLRWWKGNMHTHSHWSDGDDYPEVIAEWYKDRGYNFLVFTEHNTLASGQVWREIDKTRGGRRAYDRYVEHFGSDWVETRIQDGKEMVRLQPMDEYRTLFEEPDKFAFLPGEEISDVAKGRPIHINISNVGAVIRPQGGTSVYETIQNNINAVWAQRKELNRPVLPHLNHPNFGWAVTAEDLMKVDGENFFEVYNGHPAVRNEGDDLHASTERIWDIVLTQRLTKLNLPVMYGLATDDSHSYHETSITLSNPGRGWVMVQAKRLTPESIVNAMERGDFYSTSGVTISSIHADKSGLKIEIEGEEGVTYSTEFVGTREGFDEMSIPYTTDAGQPLPVTHKYSDEIGEVLKTVCGTSPSYTFSGDEIYVRARIVSSKKMENPYFEGETERAWVQPVVR